MQASDKNAVAYLFLDTETTGTNRYNDQIWQLSWSLETEHRTFADRDFLIQHNAKPTEWVSTRTQYNAKANEPKHSRSSVLKTLMADIESAAPLRVYLVGANPTFDDYFLQKMTWGVSGIALKYEYRLICIENLVMGFLGLAAPPGLKEIPALLGMPPFPEEELHDAKFDRKAVAKIFWHLKRLSRHRGSLPAA